MPCVKAESILVERMPGKSTVGIQVPNRQREIIWLRENVESQDFIGNKSKLTMGLGKDINGRLAVADLAGMPHLLIAGSTGAGKSVAINAFIMSILYKATPDQVRLILVDPKRLELGNYEGVPHLFTPIITEPKLAANAFRNAVREMERRLKLLAEKGVRNIDQYNKLFEDDGTLNLFGENPDERPLPYIVIIIDELADLMMLDAGNVEESVTRLAQMARAVGIHLVLATQRPSVDVITGLIKANFPARISFRVATKVDSRTILDANGAEALLGKGDMLYLPSGSARVHRLHAPFVTEKEIAAVVEFWKAQATAEYQQQFLEAPKEERERVQVAMGLARTITIRCTKMRCGWCSSSERLRLPLSSGGARRIWSRRAFDRHDGARRDCGCGGWSEAAGSVEEAGLDYGSGRRDAVGSIQHSALSSFGLRGRLYAGPFHLATGSVFRDAALKSARSSGDAPSRVACLHGRLFLFNHANCQPRQNGYGQQHGYPQNGFVLLGPGAVVGTRVVVCVLRGRGKLGLHGVGFFFEESRVVVAGWPELCVAVIEFEGGASCGAEI